MTGMENVLAAHAAQGGIGNGNADGGYVFRMCACGDRITFYFNAMTDHEYNTGKYLDAAFAAHVAEALQAAGFGSQHDAWAEGVQFAQNYDYIYPNDNPYPKVSET